jgi:cellulose 1,4-beta-cellobiosidase
VAAASAGSACPSATNSGYRVGFYPENKHATEQEVHPFFRITNTTGVFPSLTKIKLRYYFTKEPSGAETGTCFWVTGNLCSSLSFQFHDQVPSLATANRFMELTFTATNAVLDGAALEVRTGFTVAHRDLTQTNDYSFDAAAGVTATPGVFPYRDWDRVTLYVDGVLVWGTEPCVN